MQPQTNCRDMDKFVLWWSWENKVEQNIFKIFRLWAHEPVMKQGPHYRCKAAIVSFKSFGVWIFSIDTNSSDYNAHQWVGRSTVQPVCNDHLNNKIYYLWFI